MTRFAGDVRCYGEEDERGRPTCEGPDVRVVEARAPDGVHLSTEWCADCREIADADGYRLVRLGPARTTIGGVR